MSARCFMRRCDRQLVCEVTAVGEYAGRPLKAGDAAQPRGCSARFVPAGSGPFGKCRTRIGLFGVRDRGKVICECKPLSTVMYNRCCLRLCGVPGGVRYRTPEHARLY